MGILDKFFKMRGQPEQEKMKRQEKTDDFMEQIRLERKEKTRPDITTQDVRDKFYSYTGSGFDFSAVAVATTAGATEYLLDGANADKIIDDLYALNVFAKEAERIAEVPDFCAPLNDILLTPEWVERGYEMGWKTSKMVPLPLTKTGNYPKYPFRVFLISRGGERGQRLGGRLPPFVWG